MVGQRRSGGLIDSGRDVDREDVWMSLRGDDAMWSGAVGRLGWAQKKCSRQRKSVVLAECSAKRRGRRGHRRRGRHERRAGGRRRRFSGQVPRTLKGAVAHVALINACVLDDGHSQSPPHSGAGRGRISGGDPEEETPLMIATMPLGRRWRPRPVRTPARGEGRS